jgi:putative selenate reductase FAD-binding subunit
MIIEYHRPETITEALQLLSRDAPLTYALGGGTYINRVRDETYAVVDLQALSLGGIKIRGNHVDVGAACKLQELCEFNGLPEFLSRSIQLEVTYNLRQMATVAGTLVTARGRSIFSTVLLAMDARLEIQQMGLEPKLVRLGDWLPVRRQMKSGSLITRISFPINTKTSFEDIARTPTDQPIICAAVTQWKSGRTRLALGGWGDAPILAMDGPEADGIEIAAKDAYSHAGDEWASAEYRQEMAGILAFRCIQQVKNA